MRLLHSRRRPEQSLVTVEIVNRAIGLPRRSMSIEAPNNNNNNNKKERTIYLHIWFWTPKQYYRYIIHTLLSPVPITLPQTIRLCVCRIVAFYFLFQNVGISHIEETIYSNALTFVRLWASCDCGAMGNRCSGILWSTARCGFAYINGGWRW